MINDCISKQFVSQFDSFGSHFVVGHTTITLAIFPNCNELVCTKYLCASPFRGMCQTFRMYNICQWHTKICVLQQALLEHLGIEDEMGLMVPVGCLETMVYLVSQVELVHQVNLVSQAG